MRTPAQQIAELFHLPDLPDLAPRYNIAPTQPVAALRWGTDQQPECVLLHWGLIPGWADDPAIGSRLINARGETVASKPAFRQAFQRRRCLILADGFFEWQQVGGRKQPHYIRLKDDQPFALAGLWERWQREQRTIESCTIITTEPNSLMQAIHNRMPVILAPADYDLWLDTEVRSGPQLAALLRPYPADALEAYPVGTVVNNPRNDVADCIRRLAV